MFFRSGGLALSPWVCLFDLLVFVAIWGPRSRCLPNLHDATVSVNIVDNVTFGCIYVYRVGLTQKSTQKSSKVIRSFSAQPPSELYNVLFASSQSWRLIASGASYTATVPAHYAHVLCHGAASHYPHITQWMARLGGREDPLQCRPGSPHRQCRHPAGMDRSEPAKNVCLRLMLAWLRPGAIWQPDGGVVRRTGWYRWLPTPVSTWVSG